MKCGRRGVSGEEECGKVEVRGGGGREGRCWLVGGRRWVWAGFGGGVQGGGRERRRWRTEWVAVWQVWFFRICENKRFTGFFFAFGRK